MTESSLEEKESVEKYIDSLLKQNMNESKESDTTLSNSYLNIFLKNKQITDEELETLFEEPSTVDLFVKKTENNSIDFNNDIKSYSKSIQDYIDKLKEKSSDKNRKDKLNKIGGALKSLTEKREFLKNSPNITNRKVEDYIRDLENYKVDIADSSKEIQEYTAMLSGKKDILKMFETEAEEIENLKKLQEEKEKTPQEKFEEEVNLEIENENNENVEFIQEVIDKDIEEKILKKEEEVKENESKLKDYVSKISEAQKKAKEKQKFLDPESLDKSDYEKKLEKKIEKLEKKLNALTNQIGALKSGGSNWGDILRVNESFIPSQNNMYDIGAPGKRWRDLYLTGNTVILGSTALRSDGNGSIEVASASTNTITGLVDVGTYGNIGVDETQVENIVTNLLIEVPGAFEVLNQLNDALANDTNLASEITTLISQKANTSMLSNVAFTGSYNDLSDIPDRTLINLTDINTDSLSNSAILFYNSSTQTFEFSTDIDQDEIKINGGTF